MTVSLHSDQIVPNGKVHDAQSVSPPCLFQTLPVRELRQLSTAIATIATMPTTMHRPAGTALTSARGNAIAQTSAQAELTVDCFLSMKHKGPRGVCRYMLTENVSEIVH